MRSTPYKKFSFMAGHRTLCVGVRPPSDSTDGDIQTFIIYISETTGSIFLHNLIILLYVSYIRFYMFRFYMFR